MISVWLAMSCAARVEHVDDRRRLDSGVHQRRSRPGLCDETRRAVHRQRCQTPRFVVADEARLDAPDADRDHRSGLIVDRGQDAQIEAGRCHRLHDDEIGVIAEHVAHHVDGRLDTRRVGEVERDTGAHGSTDVAMAGLDSDRKADLDGRLDGVIGRHETGRGDRNAVRREQFSCRRWIETIDAVAGAPP